MELKHGLGGYVKLALTGVALEEVINEAIGQELEIWNICRTETAAYLQVSLKDFKKLLKIIRSYHGRIHIEARHGIPFAVHRIKRRKGLVIGAGLFFVLAYLVTSFVWSYEVSGNERFSASQIIAIVQGYGILPGTSLHNIDYQEIEKQLLLDYNGTLGWVDISHKGTRVIIKVQERDPLQAGSDRAAHLVARKDGVVKDILVMQGIAQVSKEQSVRAGDVLIAGISYDSRAKQEDGTYDWSGLPHLIRAKGIVRGYVDYTATGVCPLQETHLQETGQVKKDIRLLKGEKIYQLWGEGDQQPYSIFRQERHTKNLLIWQNYKSPWIWQSTTYFEQIPEQIDYSLEEAYEEAIIRARAKVAAKIGKECQFVEESITLQESAAPEVVQVEVTWRVMENMAALQFITNK